jgi:hypothetical protein
MRSVLCAIESGTLGFPLIYFGRNKPVLLGKKLTFSSELKFYKLGTYVVGILCQLTNSRLRISFLIFFFSGLAFLERRVGTAGSGLPERRLNRPPLSPLLRLQ